VLGNKKDLVVIVDRKQESLGLPRTGSVKWMNEGSGRRSTMKKEELQRTEKHIEKRTETGPRRNT
jgi:hypothetical protein